LVCLFQREASPSAESFLDYYTTSLLGDFPDTAGLREAVRYGFLKIIEWLKEHIKNLNSVAIKDLVTAAFDCKEKSSTLVRSALGSNHIIS